MHEHNVGINAEETLPYIAQLILCNSEPKYKAAKYTTQLVSNIYSQVLREEVN
jgi:hypothetical protein